MSYARAVNSAINTKMNRIYYFPAVVLVQVKLSIVLRNVFVHSRRLNLFFSWPSNGNHAQRPFTLNETYFGTLDRRPYDEYRVLHKNLGLAAGNVQNCYGIYNRIADDRSRSRP